jgi:hypothetical protein
MSLLENLCDDLKREIFLLLDDDELEKVSLNIFKDDDIFWRMKAFDTYKPTQKDIYYMAKRYVYNTAYHWKDWNYDEYEDLEYLLQTGMIKELLKFHSWKVFKESNIEYILQHDEYFDKYLHLKDYDGCTLLILVRKMFDYRRDWSCDAIQKIVDLKIVNNHRIMYYLGNNDFATFNSEEKCLTMIKLLVDQGVDPKHCYRDGYFPGHRDSYRPASEWIKDNYNEDGLREYGIWEYL